MSTVTEIRRQNARGLAMSIGGLSNFARRMGKSVSQVSQIIGKTPTRNIGNAMARKMEVEFGRPVGWADVSHDQFVFGIADEQQMFAVQIDTDLLEEVNNRELVTAIKKIRNPAQREALVTMLRAFGLLNGEES